MTDDSLRFKLVAYDCIYCGQPRTCYDHFPPRHTGVRRGFLLPACTECNSTLGGRSGLDLGERFDFVKRRLRDKNKRLLDTPQWSDEELDELGPNLRRQAAAWTSNKSVIEKRLGWEPWAALARLGVDEAEVEYVLSGALREMQNSGPSKLIDRPRETHTAPLPAPSRGIL